MRSSRALAVLGLVAVAASAGWGPFGSAHTDRPTRPQARTLGSLTIPPALREQLLGYLDLGLVPRLPVRPVPLAPGVARPGICYVAGRGCSLSPCVQFARSASAGGAVPAIALRLSVPPRAVGSPQAGPPLCQGHVGMPRIVRVSVP